jgi:hypothetical protein
MICGIGLISVVYGRLVVVILKQKSIKRSWYEVESVVIERQQKEGSGERLIDHRLTTFFEHIS